MQVFSPISFVSEHVFRHLDINLNCLYFNELKGWEGVFRFHVPALDGGKLFMP